MKRLTRAAAFLAGAVMAHSAQAGITPNDLYFGFQNQAGGGTADYIVNLGPVSSFLAPGASLDLSGDFSMGNFTSGALDGTNSADILGGVVGGASGNPASIYVTQMRNGLGTYGQAGSSAPTGLTRSQDIEAYNGLTPLNGPGSGNGVLDTSLSWENNVEPAFNAGNFYGVTGINPDSSIGTSSVVYEDLWGTSSGGSAQPFVFKGYFTIDFTGSNPNVTFTAVPEPSSMILSGAGGLLALLLRNRLWRKNG